MEGLTKLNFNCYKIYLLIIPIHHRSLDKKKLRQNQSVYQCMCAENYDSF